MHVFALVKVKYPVVNASLKFVIMNLERSGKVLKSPWIYFQKFCANPEYSSLMHTPNSKRLFSLLYVPSSLCCFCSAIGDWPPVQHHLQAVWPDYATFVPSLQLIFLISILLQVYAWATFLNGRPDSEFTSYRGAKKFLHWFPWPSTPLPPAESGTCILPMTTQRWSTATWPRRLDIISI